MVKIYISGLGLEPGGGFATIASKSTWTQVAQLQSQIKEVVPTGPAGPKGRYRSHWCNRTRRPKGDTRCCTWDVGTQNGDPWDRRRYRAAAGPIDRKATPAERRTTGPKAIRAAGATGPAGPIDDTGTLVQQDPQDRRRYRTLVQQDPQDRRRYRSRWCNRTRRTERRYRRRWCNRTRRG